MSIKASIYCSSCGTQNIVESPVEGMEVVCSSCNKSIILKKKVGGSSRRMSITQQIPKSSLATSGSSSSESAKMSASVSSNLVDANLKMMNRIEELEEEIFRIQKENKDLQKQLTDAIVKQKEAHSKLSGEYQGKDLLEAILLEVKDQKAGQELAQALGRKDADTLYKTINAMMLEIYEIKKEISRSNESTNP